MNEIIKLQEMFYQDRPRMAEANNDIFQVFGLLLGEVHEAMEALHLRSQGRKTDKDVATELSDIFLFTLACFRALGFDAEAEVKEKIARNACKYHAKTFSDGIPYGEAIAQSKEIWRRTGGDEEFYQR